MLGLEARKVVSQLRQDAACPVFVQLSGDCGMSTTQKSHLYIILLYLLEAFNTICAISSTGGSINGRVLAYSLLPRGISL